MALVETLVASCRYRAKQCPDITIQHAIGQVVKEFCRDSWYYQKTLFLNTVAEQDVYSLNLDLDDEVIAIQAVQFKDIPLTSVRQQDYKPYAGDPRFFQYEPPYYLLLSPVPTVDETNSLKIRTVLQRSESSTTIPEEIWRSHSETLEAGTLAFLFAIPDEIWTDYSLSKFYDIKFRAGIQEAKRMRHRGFVSGSLQIRPRSIL